VVPVVADMADPGRPARLVDAAVDASGGLQIAVANASGGLQIAVANASGGLQIAVANASGGLQIAVANAYVTGSALAVDGGWSRSLL
jgi:NAD(P)-dependent dehydrogenase (short-subunit alcohol dehydrogenase family)